MADISHQAIDYELTEEIPLIICNGVQDSYPADNCEPIHKVKTQGESISAKKGEMKESIKSTLGDVSSIHDLNGDGVRMNRIWRRKFGKESNINAQSWKHYRLAVTKQFQTFEAKLRGIEKAMSNDKGLERGSNVLSVEMIEEKRGLIDDISSQIESIEAEFVDVSKAFEEFSQFLPQDDNRVNADILIGSLRHRYWKFRLDFYRQKEIVSLLTPRLEDFNLYGNVMKDWLNTMEPRCNSVMTDLNNNSYILPNEGIIEEIVGEIHVKKEDYNNFLVPGKEMIQIEHQMDPVELLHKTDEVVPRWEAICEKMESCLNMVKEEKKAVALVTKHNNKTEVEKIYDCVRHEEEKCTCAVPFKIKKVGDGKYTFGDSKIVRLLRIHGSSVVVRVGGGWEYLSNFLFKVDPCRAKQHIASSPSATYRSPSVTLGKVAKESTLSIVSPRDVTQIVEVIKEPGDQVHRITSSDILNLSHSTPPSTSRLLRSCDVSSSDTARSEKSSTRKAKCKTDSGTPRMTLMERQAMYAQKR